MSFLSKVKNYSTREIQIAIGALQLSRSGLKGANYFLSPVEALSEAMNQVAAISPVVAVGPSLSFDEFVDDSDLQKYVVP